MRSIIIITALNEFAYKADVNLRYVLISDHLI